MPLSRRDPGLPGMLPRSRANRQAVGALAVAIALGGCGGLTDVEAPDVVQPADLANAAGADAVRAGALRSFALAYAGPLPAQVTVSGLMADEFTTATLVRESIAFVADLRVLPEPGTAYPYAAVHLARVAALDAVAALQRFAPQPSSRIGELLVLAGYTEIFLAENLCAGVPLGGVENGRPVFGRQLTTSELLERALSDLDSALVYGADSARIAHLARVGRGRALLGLGRFADAAAAVAAVPSAYVHATNHGATVQRNGVFEAMNSSRQLSVADSEGGTGLPFRTAADPRVPTHLVGRSADGLVDVYAYTPYAALTTPVPLATGVEARLIEAEAALRAGDAGGALATLNALRAGTAGLPPLSDAGSDSARVDQLFRERAFWLFATGHRHGDLRRLVRQYGRTAESVFPTGPLRQGFSYGVDVTFPPDDSQRTNPSYAGCLDRAA